MTDELQDLFISHASPDKPGFIQPLADLLVDRKITFWLDSVEIAWGDSIPLKINEGLRRSRFVLLCLSANFLNRPWPEAELAAALAVQNSTGKKRVLPLILDSKELVLQTYPLLASLAYKEYPTPPDSLVDEIANLVRPAKSETDHVRVIVESVHTGKICNIEVSSQVSLKWLADRAQGGLSLSERAETGGYEPFRIRWVLVDTKVEDVWLKLPRRQQRGVFALVASTSGPQFCKDNRKRLSQIGIADGAIFHLYAIEDERYDPPAARAAG